MRYSCIVLDNYQDMKADLPYIPFGQDTACMAPVAKTNLCISRFTLSGL